MTCISVAIKVVICAAISLLVVKLAIDQQRVAWHAKQLHLQQPEKCADILLGPDMRLDWPNWRIYADQLAEEVKIADKEKASSMKLPLILFGCHLYIKFDPPKDPDDAAEIDGQFCPLSF